RPTRRRLGHRRRHPAAGRWKPPLPRALRRGRAHVRHHDGWSALLLGLQHLWPGRRPSLRRARSQPPTDQDPAGVLAGLSPPPGRAPGTNRVLARPRALLSLTLPRPGRRIMHDNRLDPRAEGARWPKESAGGRAAAAPARPRPPGAGARRRPPPRPAPAPGP